MKISAICIERPVFATVLSLVIMLLGLVSYVSAHDIWHRFERYLAQA